jgi:hypothetical protein
LAVPAPRYTRSNGASPAAAPVSSGDRIPPPGRSGDRIPVAGPGGNRMPPPGQSGDRIPAPGRSDDRIPVPAPGHSGDRIPAPGPSGMRPPPSGEWPPGAPGAPLGVPPRAPGAKGRPPAKRTGTKNAMGKAKNPKNARKPKSAAGRGKGPARAAAPPKPEKKTGGLAPVYDIDGPRVRLGVAWFLAAVAAVVASTITAALCYAIAAGFAARQIVRAWKSVAWQADLAAGLAGAIVVSAVGGTNVVIGVAVVALVTVVGVAFFHPDGGRLPGTQGRVAAALIMIMALVPALGGVTLVLARGQDVTTALVLLLLVSAYEAGDYIVGSGASNFIEGPLAGITTALVLGFPLMLVLMPPFDDAGPALLVFLAATLPLGQVMASVLLPRAGAHAPALRRIDTLLLLAPVWAAAASAF